jgi:hypothetical protein
MRALVIGFPLPSPQIDNYNIVTSPSWYDYDAVVVDPLSVSLVIQDVLEHREDHQTRGEEPVLNRPTSPFGVSLGDTIRRRRSEVGQLLARGGVVVVFARPDAVHDDVTGFPGCNRYAFLPAPAGVTYDAPFLLRAEGTEVHAVDSTHPFGQFVEKHKRWVSYRARFDADVSGFASFGHVFARSVGGAPVGVELRVGGGRIILLPAFGSVAYGDQRFQMASDMLDAVRRCLVPTDDGAQPAWLADVKLPGVDHLEACEREAATAAESAQVRLEGIREELGELTQFRSLLWREGPFGLEPVVRDAFRKLGFDVEANADRPGWVADGAARAFFEVEASEAAVEEWPYFRIQKRLEKDLLETREPKKGIIVVNGFRRQAPADRTAQTTDALRVAAENYRYALLTTDRLFNMVRAAMTHPDNADLLRTIRKRLLETVGEVGDDAVPSVDAEE